jgi:hypothetical protein
METIARGTGWKSDTGALLAHSKHCVFERIADCTFRGMQIPFEKNTSAKFVAAVAGGVGIVLLARWLSRSRASIDEFSFPVTSEQATTIKAPLEAVENGWIEWCASGHARLKNDYAIRFEPAPGARGTEVHLSGGGSTGAIREELRRFKQRLETGEIPASDGPGLSRPAQPRQSDDVSKEAEVL